MHLRVRIRGESSSPLERAIEMRRANRSARAIYSALVLRAHRHSSVSRQRNTRIRKATALHNTYYSVQFILSLSIFSFSHSFFLSSLSLTRRVCAAFDCLRRGGANTGRARRTDEEERSARVCARKWRVRFPPRFESLLVESPRVASRRRTLRSPPKRLGLLLPHSSAD